MARILVIEDTADIRELFKRVLERAGFEVHTAPDGNAGLRLYREHLPDLVITDILMPDKEGLETIMELRRDFPEAKIIAISGGGQATPSLTCLTLAQRLGALRTFAKPVDLTQLLAAVREVLSG